MQVKEEPTYQPCCLNGSHWWICATILMLLESRGRIISGNWTLKRSFWLSIIVFICRCVNVCDILQSSNSTWWICGVSDVSALEEKISILLVVKPTNELIIYKKEKRFFKWFFINWRDLITVWPCNLSIVYKETSHGVFHRHIYMFIKKNNMHIDS